MQRSARQAAVGARSHHKIARLVIASLALSLAAAEAAQPLGPQPAEPSTSLAAKAGRRARLRADDCEYAKGPWQPCQPDGLQRRELRLKDASQAGACEPLRLLRRQCTLGCKYARGQWSPECLDGVRTRTDTLVAPRRRAGRPRGNSSEPLAASCPSERKVTRECRRSCHYLKSAWSDCVAGFKTRNLTLDASPVADGRRSVLTGLGCAASKQVRRACRPKPTSTPVPTSAAAAKDGGGDVGRRKTSGRRAKGAQRSRKNKKQAQNATSNLL